MALTVTTTTKAELKIAPSLKRKTLQTLRTYADLKSEKDAIEEQMDTCKVILGGTLETLGESAIELEGFKLTTVSGTYKKLNEQKLVELGCAIAWIREATEEHLKKSYTKISCPGEKSTHE